MEGHATKLTLKSEIDMSIDVLMPPHIAEMMWGSSMMRIDGWIDGWVRVGIHAPDTVWRQWDAC